MTRPVAGEKGGHDDPSPNPLGPHQSSAPKRRRTSDGRRRNPLDADLPRVPRDACEAAAAGLLAISVSARDRRIVDPPDDEPFVRARRCAGLGSVRCRTRSCRSTASARSASIAQEAKPSVLIVPGVLSAGSTSRRWATDIASKDTTRHARHFVHGRRTDSRGVIRRHSAARRTDAAWIPSIRWLFYTSGSTADPEGRASDRQQRSWATGKGMAECPGPHARRSQWVFRLPVHAHRRDR